jgi:hypothetical protein
MIDGGSAESHDDARDPGAEGSVTSGGGTSKDVPCSARLTPNRGQDAERDEVGHHRRAEPRS